MTTLRYHHHGFLGTVVELGLQLDPEQIDREGTDLLGQAAFEVLLDEIDRLQRVFSAFDPSSELSRWRAGESVENSEPFVTLMTQVLDWQERTGGAFNPAIGEISALWAEAEPVGRKPEPETLSSVVARVTRPVFRLDAAGHPELAAGPVPGFNLNAMAKGFIVDRALDHMAGRMPDLDVAFEAVVVNAGGDIRQRGRRPSKVGIENPLRPYDNEPPLVVISVKDQAVATSGGARRGFRVDGRRHSHVIDPRTGRPVDHGREAPASVSIVAPDAMTADVVATAASVIDPVEVIGRLDELEDVEALVIAADGSTRATTGWGELLVRT